jgi:hypothetical protein
MQTQSRIPQLLNNSYSSMNDWFSKMQANGLLFHPEDRAGDIVEIVSGKPIFSAKECTELDQIIDGMFEIHGEKVCDAAYKYVHEEFLQMIAH